MCKILLTDGDPESPWAWAWAKGANMGHLGGTATPGSDGTFPMDGWERKGDY